MLVLYIHTHHKHAYHELVRREESIVYTFARISVNDDDAQNRHHASTMTRLWWSRIGCWHEKFIQWNGISGYLATSRTQVRLVPLMYGAIRCDAIVCGQEGSAFQVAYVSIMRYTSDECGRELRASCK